MSEGSEKIDITHALNVFRNRLDGTEYTASDNKAERKANPKTHKRPIGSINTMQAHIFQIKEGYPKEAPGLMWMTLGSPLNIPWVPIFPDINDSTPEAKNDSPVYDPNSYYWVGLNFTLKTRLRQQNSLLLKLWNGKKKPLTWKKAFKKNFHKFLRLT